jgi:hypothetical protein
MMELLVKHGANDATTRPTTDSHRLPLCRLCEKLTSEIKCRIAIESVVDDTLES